MIRFLTTRFPTTRFPTMLSATTRPPLSALALALALVLSACGADSSPSDAATATRDATRAAESGGDAHDHDDDTHADDGARGVPDSHNDDGDDDHAHGAAGSSVEDDARFPARPDSDAADHDDRDAGTSADDHDHASRTGDDDHHDEPARTTIPADIAESSGIVVAPAGPGTIRDEHDVQGLLLPVEGRHARVVARFPGPVTAVRVGVGDVVRKGQALATVESNLSLSAYTIVSPLSGTVLARDAGVGDLAGEQPLFEIADLSTLWVDLHLFGADAQHIVPGLRVQVRRLSDGVTAETTLDRVLPATATASQSTIARATLDNADGRWRPGAAVRARVTVAEQAVPLVVPLTALQTMDGRDVVFVRDGDDYDARPLRLGRRDGERVEVLDGLRAGEQVVVAQSYLLKADIGKAGAAHEH